MLRLLILGGLGYAAYRYLQSNPEVMTKVQDQVRNVQDKVNSYVRDLGGQERKTQPQ
jgi:hypothetical protein